MKASFTVNHQLNHPDKPNLVGWYQYICQDSFNNGFRKKIFKFLILGTLVNGICKLLRNVVGLSKLNWTRGSSLIVSFDQEKCRTLLIFQSIRGSQRPATDFYPSNLQHLGLTSVTWKLILTMFRYHKFICQRF